MRRSPRGWGSAGGDPLIYNHMVVDSPPDGEAVDRLFRALADPTRRDIVSRTLGEEHSVSALARQYPMSVTAVQKHVAVLARAGVVSKRRHGREQIVRADGSALRRAHLALDRLEDTWRRRIEGIDRILSQPENGDAQCQ